MVDAVWPATLPTEPLQGSYSEALHPNVIAFQPDAGPPTTLRRGTLRGGKLAATFRLTEAQFEDWLDFYYGPLASGATPFTWTSPVYGASLRYRVDPEAPPEWDVSGLAGSGFVYRLRIALHRLGDVTLTDPGGAAEWPASVPHEPERGSYLERPASTLTGGSLGGATPQSWQRSTSRASAVSGTWLMTTAEWLNFRRFFEVRLASGSRPFTWANPAHASAGRYLFDPASPPEYEPIGSGDIHRVKLKLLKLS